MKKLALAALIASISFAGSSFAPVANAPSVVIKKGRMKIEGINVTADWSITSFKKAIGEPDRVDDGYNKTHTYDTKNIVLFEKVENKIPTGKVSEIQFHFNVSEPNEATPNGSTFTGTLIVDKLKITRDLSATTMLSKLKTWKKTECYLENSYRMSNKGMYIYFHFNNSEDKLEKASIGPDNSF